MKPLVEVVDQAIQDISVYQSPDLSEFRSRINAICEAAGLNRPGGDSIDSIHLRSGLLSIEYSWSCRGCSCDSDVSIPLGIIQAEDPIKAANLWRLENKITKIKGNINEKKFQLKGLPEEISVLEEACARLET